MTSWSFQTLSVPGSWEEGMIAGSGRVGVVVHGQVDRQVLTVRWQHAAGGRCSVRVPTPRDEETVWVAIDSERELVVTLRFSSRSSADSAAL